MGFLLPWSRLSHTKQTALFRLFGRGLFSHSYLCVPEETMSKTDSKAAADMTEAVSLSGVSRRSVLSDTCFFDGFLSLQMEKTMERLQGRFQAVSEQLESKNILLKRKKLQPATSTETIAVNLTLRRFRSGV